MKLVVSEAKIAMVWNNVKTLVGCFLWLSLVQHFNTRRLYQVTTLHLNKSLANTGKYQVIGNDCCTCIYLSNCIIIGLLSNSVRVWVCIIIGLSYCMLKLCCYCQLIFCLCTNSDCVNCWYLINSKRNRIPFMNTVTIQAISTLCYIIQSRTCL